MASRKPLLPRITAFALVLAHTFTSTAARADMATTTLGGLNSALTGLNSFNTAFGASNLELQSLATQLAGAQAQTAQGATQQGQFDQIGQQLQAAMLEAQQCVQQATRTYAKYHKKHKEAANIPADKLTSAEPTCKNYGTLMDAISVNKERMIDANKKMACMMNLQNKVGQLAEKAKQPFQQLMTSAGEVYKTHSQIIDAHKKIAEKLKNDVDGPDGKGGYRARLVKLRNLSLELNNILNAKKSEKDGLKHGLVKQVDELHTQRSAMGNDWYYTLMGEVEYCYSSTPAPCFDNNENMPPAQCVVALVGNEAGKTPGGRARATTDDIGLRNLGRLNYQNAQKINLPANIDIAKPDEFLSFARKRFDDTVGGVVTNYRNHAFALKVDKNKLKDAVTQGYNACWDQTVAAFHADLQSKGNRYYSKITAMKDAERETSNDIKNWIDRVEGEMTEFRTSFHKVYNSELSQFKTDCTADEDPYRSLDCLRVMAATLDSGIKGTRRATKLGNGTQFVSNAGETQIPMQTLTTDANGKPTIGSTNAACVGFDDCINYLDRSRADHEGAASKGEDDRSKFVQQHNVAVRSAFDIVSNHFTSMSQLVMAGVKGVNDELTKIGIKAALKTKDIESEPLVENKDTGMIDMPKSMKAALAGRNAFTEIDDTKSVTEAYNNLATELNKKAADAAKMKNKCKIEKADYEALQSLMPKSCSDTRAICNRSPLSASQRIEELLRRSKVTIEDNEKLSNNTEYNRCRNDIMQDTRSVTSAEIRRAGRNGRPISNVAITTNTHGSTSTATTRDQDAYDEARDQAIADKQDEAKRRVKVECTDVIFSTLYGEAGKGRYDNLRNQNNRIVTGLKDVMEACANVPDRASSTSTDTATSVSVDPNEENEAVTSACEEFKNAAKAAQPPKDEDETVVAGDGTSSPTTNPLVFPGSGTTAPAR